MTCVADMRWRRRRRRISLSVSGGNGGGGATLIKFLARAAIGEGLEFLRVSLKSLENRHLPAHRPIQETREDQPPPRNQSVGDRGGGGSREERCVLGHLFGCRPLSLFLPLSGFPLGTVPGIPPARNVQIL